MQGAARRIPADSSYRSPSSPSPQSHTTISLLATATPAALFCQRLGKARRRAPIARPATVRGRVSGRIGPLVLGSRRCEQAAEQEPGPFALGARATAEPQAVLPTLGHPSRPRSRRTGPLFSHAERAALVGRFDAKRWPIRRTIGRRSVAQPSRGPRGQLRRLGAALESPQTRVRCIVRVAQSPTRPVSSRTAHVPKNTA